MTAPATIHTAPVPEPVRQLRALVARGFHPRFLSRHLHMDVMPTLCGFGAPLNPATIYQISTLYQRLRHQLGPDGTIATQAIALGWSTHPAETPADPADHEPDPDPDPADELTITQIRHQLAAGTLTRVSAIRKLAALGLTDNQIGALVGLRRSSVGTARRRNNIPTAWETRWTTEVLDRVRRLAAAGWTDHQIGEDIGATRGAVTEARKRHGIPAGVPRGHHATRP